MASGDFRPVFRTTKAPVSRRPASALSSLIKDSLKLPALLAIGALVQTIVLAALPVPYSLIPLALVFLRSVMTTILQSRSSKSNTFISDTVLGRVTAQIPSRSTGAFGSQPASQSLVVFHLGVRFNHPLGLLSPGAKDIGDHFGAMTESLRARRDEFGMLHFSSWSDNERESNNNTMMIAYFRDIQGLNRFAHDRVHRDGWDWYHQFVKKQGYRHIGIFHETFVTQPGNYETIYLDCAPTLLGASNVRVNVDDEKAAGDQAQDESWVRPLVSADHSALRSQSKRMGTTLGLKEDTRY